MSLMPSPLPSNTSRSGAGWGSRFEKYGRLIWGSEEAVRIGERIQIPVKDTSMRQRTGNQSMELSAVRERFVDKLSPFSVLPQQLGLSVCRPSPEQLLRSATTVSTQTGGVELLQISRSDSGQTCAAFLSYYKQPSHQARYR